MDYVLIILLYVFFKRLHFIHSDFTVKYTLYACDKYWFIHKDVNFLLGDYNCILCIVQKMISKTLLALAYCLFLYKWNRLYIIYSSSVSCEKWRCLFKSRQSAGTCVTRFRFRGDGSVASCLAEGGSRMCEISHVFVVMVRERSDMHANTYLPLPLSSASSLAGWSVSLL